MLERFLAAAAVVILAAANVFAQSGGKAEPRRINFAAASASAVVTGMLARGREAEYIFFARKGETVTIRNPRSSAFDFRIFSEEFDVETEFESSPTLTLEIEQTGDYRFFVRRKMAGSVRPARFSLTITVR